MFYLSFILESVYNIQVIPLQGMSAKNITLYLFVLLAGIRYLRGNAPLFDEGKVFISTLAFVGWCLFSLVITYFTQGTNLISEIIFFKSYMDPYILMIIAYHLLQDEDEAKFLLFSLMVFIVLCNLLTVLSASGLIHIKRATVDATYGRTRGVFSEPNQYAAAVALFLPGLIGYMIKAKGLIIKSCVLAGIFMSILCLLFTGSRGGLVGMAVGIFTLLILGRTGKGSVPISKGIIALIIIALVSIVVLSVLPDTTQKGLSHNVVDRAKSQDLDQYSSGRLYAWRVGLNMFSENPILGIGWNTFAKRVGYNSHSDFVLFLVTTGIPGFLFFCNLLYRIWASVRKCRKIDNENDDAYIWYLAGFLSFVATMAFVNMFNVSFFFFLYTAAILKIGASAKMNKKALA